MRQKVAYIWKASEEEVTFKIYMFGRSDNILQEEHVTFAVD
jgi:hypothetical protein